MEGKLKVIAVLPAYNAEKTLEATIRALPRGSMDEIILVDDASTDDSVAIIKSLIQGNPRAQFFVNPVNIGANRTVNDSLGRARSEYVLLLSANDYVLPGIFSRAKACLARSPGVGVWSAMAWLVDEEDRPIRLHPSPVVALHDALFPPERCVKLAHRFGNWFTF